MLGANPNQYILPSVYIYPVKEVIQMTTEYFKEKVCKYCKADCTKALVFEEKENETVIHCIDYEKDATKIEGYKKPLERSAKLERCVMPNLITNWNKY